MSCVLYERFEGRTMGCHVERGHAFNRSVGTRQSFVYRVQILVTEAVTGDAESAAICVSSQAVRTNDCVVAAAPLWQALPHGNHCLMLTPSEGCNPRQHV